MAKLLVILLIGLVFESTGVVLLKKGMNRLGKVTTVNISEVIRIVKAAATNSHILLGIFFEALFFICLLILMSESDISFLWPMTALSFVFSTMAALLFLHERVTPLRWVGVVFIMLGAAFISYSEHATPKSPPVPETRAAL
jgi:drug/metabolite transporter (DMT)-like permease